MSINLNLELSKLSNDELVIAFNNLKKACKKSPRIAFGIGIKALSPYVLNGRSRKYDDNTANNYIGKLKGLPHHDWEKERKYIITLIQTACTEWKITKSGKNEFKRFAGIKGDKIATEGSFRHAGNYFLYCPTSNADAISRYPLHIDNTGHARIVFSRLSGDDSKDILEGSASFDGHSMLTISFSEEANVTKFKHYMFSVADQLHHNLRNAYGVSIRTNQNREPIGRMEILITTDDKVEDPTVVYKEFTIDSEEFRKEDLKRDGMLTWLTGKLNRTIVVPTKPNRIHSTRISGYKDIHFHAACYLAMREEYKDSLIYLYQAYLHGFYDVARMDKEISSGGCLATLYGLSITAVPTHSKDHHVRLSCSELVDRIRSRAAHIMKLPPNENENENTGDGPH